MYSTVEDLRKSIVGRSWADKMLHDVPNIPVVKNRAAYLLEKAKGKVVLDIGCTGVLSQAIKGVAKKYYGIDKAPEATHVVNLDEDQMPVLEDVELIIASEVLEHLSNPGNFLAGLKQAYPGKTCFITVPNAGSYTVKDGKEVVNDDHVCWYSYQTLQTLLKRYAIEIVNMRWYNGEPHKAEGLIAEIKL
jgi:predicted TPR repeat methyltransferase